MHVYFILNHINWKYYIGKTKESDFVRYWSNQKYRIFKAAKRDIKPYLYNAVRKCGWENFSIHSLRSDFISEEECLMWEQTMIKTFRSQDHTVGYNICAGGRGAIGWKPTLEQRIKMGASRKGKPGRKQTPETRAKIRAAIAGLIASGQYRSPETCVKISATKKHKGQTAKQKDVWKTLLATKHHSGLPAGYKHSQETKLRISLAKIGHRAPNAKNMTGLNLNGIQVLERAGSTKSGKATWLCRCECGNTFVPSGDNLRNGHTRSCGCLSKSQY
jgi:group I intron endonuclease